MRAAKLAVLAGVLAMCGAMPALEPWVVSDGFLADDETGRSLAEKRKSCNITNLPGDFRYEACGEFCKEQKASNHCRYCKCASCVFCKASVSTMASTLHTNKEVKRTKRHGSRDPDQVGPIQVAAGVGKKRLRGKGLGKKKKGEPPL